MRIPAFLLAVSVCAASAHAAQDTPANASADERIDERVQALIAKVKRSLRPLKGGTFAMGDWGGESGLPFDMDAHSKPSHKVTLDGFSMMAYKVTYEDFDVFTDATGSERINISFKPSAGVDRLYGGHASGRDCRSFARRQGVRQLPRGAVYGRVGVK